MAEGAPVALVTRISDINLSMKGRLVTVEGIVYRKSLRRKSLAGTDFFQVVLTSPSGEINLGFIGRAAVDSFYDFIKVDKSYRFVNMRVEPFPPEVNYSGTPHAAELSVSFKDDDVVVHNLGAVPPPDFGATPPVQQVLDGKYEMAQDMIGVCTYVGPCELKYNRMTGEPFLMRNVHITDHSQTAILALFREEAENFELDDDHEINVVAIKGAMLTHYGPGFSRSLKTTSVSRLMVNPECPRANKLRKWYEKSYIHPEYL